MHNMEITGAVWDEAQPRLNSNSCIISEKPNTLYVPALQATETDYISVHELLCKMGKREQPVSNIEVS